MALHNFCLIYFVCRFLGTCNLAWAFFFAPVEHGGAFFACYHLPPKFFPLLASYYFSHAGLIKRLYRTNNSLFLKVQIIGPFFLSRVSFSYLTKSKDRTVEFCDLSKPFFITFAQIITIESHTHWSLFFFSRRISISSIKEFLFDLYLG